jgi:hypothetical protein
MAVAHDWKHQQEALRAAMWTALVESAFLWILTFIAIIFLILLFGA